MKTYERQLDGTHYKIVASAVGGATIMADRGHVATAILIPPALILDVVATLLEINEDTLAEQLHDMHEEWINYGDEARPE